MKKEYESIQELISKNLSTEEDRETQDLIGELQDVLHRGYFTKEEFVKMGMWKSPRPKNWYLANSEDRIIEISQRVFATHFEKRRIELLTQLEGVAIPVSSAILTLTDPKNYGVIDIRVWDVVYTYGLVKVNRRGTNFSFNNWYNYLVKLRYFAEKFKVKARDIERTIFLYHWKVQKGRLGSKSVSRPDNSA